MLKISSFVAKFALACAGLLAASSTYGQATTCRFSSLSGVAFGSYDDGSSVPRDTTSDVTIDCARNGGPQNLNITLSLGPSSTSGSIGNRSMRLGSGAAINYNLYRDSSRALVWGQTPGVDTVSRSLSIPNKSSASTTFTIFGRISALQSASVGTYADSVVATVSY